jgi:hypothetical protein
VGCCGLHVCPHKQTSARAVLADALSPNFSQSIKQRAAVNTLARRPDPGAGYNSPSRVRITARYAVWRPWSREKSGNYRSEIPAIRQTAQGQPLAPAVHLHHPTRTQVLQDAVPASQTMGVGRGVKRMTERSPALPDRDQGEARGAGALCHVAARCGATRWRSQIKVTEPQP